MAALLGVLPILFGRLPVVWAGTSGGKLWLTTPAVALQQPLRIRLAEGCGFDSQEGVILTREGDTLRLFATLASGPDKTGECQQRGYLIVRDDRFASGTTAVNHLLRWVVEDEGESSGEPPPASVFQFRQTSDTTVTLYEGELPVLAYNFGPITNQKVPEKDPRRTRACYVHPVWGVDGEVLTDDFPRDHYHHHGIFWTWPHVVIGQEEFSLWEDRGALRQRFVRWLCQETHPGVAVLGVENAWDLNGQTMLTERVWFTVYARGKDDRVIDVDLFLQPRVPITLWGAEGKSYGGLTMRFRPPSEKEAWITVPDGLTKDDLYETRLPWADFTSHFGETDQLSGATIMVAPTHPDYPPTWLTRHYGPLCVGWPGVHSRTLEPPETVHLPYRLWIHRGSRTAEEIAPIYKAYTAGFECQLAEKPVVQKVSQ
ncbi:DUF6807 family protein [Thermogutta sp.]|uniref:DUF6807 family protein n=1 Tax=Thermogutta sp. TaxID=1962930 RepID=UPI00321FE5FA